MEEEIGFERGRPNLTFFGNGVSRLGALEELYVFLDEVNKFIDKKHLDLQADKTDEDTLENVKYHFQYSLEEILRKSVINSIVILVESEIGLYCETFKKYKRLKIGIKDLKGDLLNRFKTFMTKILTSNLDFSSATWQKI